MIAQLLALAALALTTKPAAHPIRILVDSIHAHNSLHERPDHFEYHYTYGFRTGFGYLRSRGVQVDEVGKGVLDSKRLSGAHVLFINLVSADLPPFRLSEIDAIKRFVAKGGGLFVITDHTNCYYHAYKLAPLFDALGIEIRTEAALEAPPMTIGVGNAWIWVRKFNRHPLTEGLRAIGLQTGGTVDDRYAVAWTSKDSWGDQWTAHPFGENDRPGFYGNFKQDAGERKGPLGVILAKTLGKGRIAVIADQNAFGDPFINYQDNWKLWLNTFAWLSGSRDLASARQYLRWKGKRFTAYEQPSRAAFGSGRRNGYFNLFGGLCRECAIFATDDLRNAGDAIVFAHDAFRLPESTLKDVIRHMRAGKSIFILGDLHMRGGDSIMAQLRHALGEPTVEDQEGVQVNHWQGCGPVMLLPQNNLYQNSFLPAPEVKPTTEQSAVIDALAQALLESTKKK